MARVKKFCSLTVVFLAAIASVAGVSQVPIIREDDPPTFYFTRLVYEENGFRSRGTMAPPSTQSRCPEFGGGDFFPQQGWGWATDYPGGDCKFMGGVHRLTSRSSGIRRLGGLFLLRTAGQRKRGQHSSNSNLRVHV